MLAGGKVDDSVGWFVRPTIVESAAPDDAMFATEYFGPILAVHVYEDRDFEKVVDQMESFAPYALTGSIIAQDRHAVAWATERLRYAAGNFYVNDKPTGAVVGQQPFGGARASGTNDKAGQRGEPAALDLAAQHQGDLRAADRLPLPLHGLTVATLPYELVGPVVEHLGQLHSYERWLVVVVAFGPFVVLGLVVRAARRRRGRGGAGRRRTDRPPRPSASPASQAAPLACSRSSDWVIMSTRSFSILPPTSGRLALASPLNRSTVPSPSGSTTIDAAQVTGLARDRELEAGLGGRSTPRAARAGWCRRRSSWRTRGSRACAAAGRPRRPCDRPARRSRTEWPAERVRLLSPAR